MGAAPSMAGIGRTGRLQASAGYMGEVPRTPPEWMDPTRAGGTVPAPSPGQRAAAIAACSGLFARPPISRAALSARQGLEAAQGPSARQGHRLREGEGVPQITRADKWVSNGVLSLAPPGPAHLQGDEGMWPWQDPHLAWAPALPVPPAEPGVSPLLGGVTPATPAPSSTGCPRRVLPGPPMRNEDPMPMASPWHGRHTWHLARGYPSCPQGCRLKLLGCPGPLSPAPQACPKPYPVRHR